MILQMISEHEVSSDSRSPGKSVAASLNAPSFPAKRSERTIGHPKVKISDPMRIQEEQIRRERKHSIVRRGQSLVQIVFVESPTGKGK